MTTIRNIVTAGIDAYDANNIDTLYDCFQQLYSISCTPDDVLNKILSPTAFAAMQSQMAQGQLNHDRDFANPIS